jgi:hypothetical protein
LGINEWDLREEDKEEGRTQKRDLIFCFRISEFLKDRGGGVNWKNCFGEVSQDTVVAGNFGLGGQETVRIPGARESERLFLVGWEVNIQYGQEQEHDQIEKGLDRPTCRWRYVLCYCYHYSIVVVDIFLFLSLSCCYCLFLVYSKYKKIMKEIINEILVI